MIHGWIGLRSCNWTKHKLHLTWWNTKKIFGFINHPIMLLWSVKPIRHITQVAPSASNRKPVKIRRSKVTTFQLQGGPLMEKGLAHKCEIKDTLAPKIRILKTRLTAWKNGRTSVKIGIIHRLTVPVNLAQTVTNVWICLYAWVHKDRTEVKAKQENSWKLVCITQIEHNLLITLKAL